MPEADAFEKLLREVAALPDRVVPERVGRFEILGELGRGGFGVVYEARDTELGRHVAIKMLRPLAETDHAHFRTEAEAVARLGHPNIVTLFDFGHFEGQPYLVFERLQGKTLERRLLEGPLDLAAALDVGVAVLRGLAHAHRAGVLHRDVKPGNVFLALDGPVKLLDFGLSNRVGGAGRGGTPGFMAPEQGRGVEDARTDVYAAGLVIRRMIAPDSIPAELEALLARATDPEPGRRFADASSMLQALLALDAQRRRDDLAPARRLLGDRRDEARRALFVGRARERELLRRAVAGIGGPRILFLCGIAGIGKTTLLHELAQVAADAGAAPVFLDARDVEARPEGFLRALGSALGLPSERSGLDHLAAGRSAHVLLIDGYETLSPIDAWLREWLLPRLPEHVLVVLAGRNPPAGEWSSDPAWRDLVEVVAVGALTPEESTELLRRRRVQDDRLARALAFAHGHPLALAMAADVVAQHGDEGLDPVADPDLVQELLRRFRESAPSASHREALEAAAVLRTVTEPLLAELTGSEALFDWLAGLSFMAREPRGLSMHELVRNLVVADLRWRAPERHQALVVRAHGGLMGRLERAGGRDVLRLTCELMFIHEHHPAVAQFTSWQGTADLTVTSATRRDIPALIEMVERHEGADSAAHAGRWMDRQLDGVQVVRDRAGDPVGFLSTVTLTRARADDIAADPATRAAREVLGVLPVGRHATMFRFWMSRDGHQSISPVQSLLSALMVRHQLTTPGLAWALFPCADPAFWAPHMEFIRALRMEGMAFDVRDRRYGVYAHDFRDQSPAAWLASLLTGPPPT